MSCRKATTDEKCIYATIYLDSVTGSQLGHCNKAGVVAFEDKAGTSIYCEEHARSHLSSIICAIRLAESSIKRWTEKQEFLQKLLN